MAWDAIPQAGRWVDPNGEAPPAYRPVSGERRLLVRMLRDAVWLAAKGAYGWAQGGWPTHAQWEAVVWVYDDDPAGYEYAWTIAATCERLDIDLAGVRRALADPETIARIATQRPVEEDREKLGWQLGGTRRRVDGVPSHPRRVRAAIWAA